VPIGRSVSAFSAAAELRIISLVDDHFLAFGDVATFSITFSQVWITLK
jgi:hypothetical protein